MIYTKFGITNIESSKVDHNHGIQHVQGHVKIPNIQSIQVVHDHDSQIMEVVDSTHVHSHENQDGQPYI